jgi:hypothetical protein
MKVNKFGFVMMTSLALLLAACNDKEEELEKEDVTEIEDVQGEKEKKKEVELAEDKEAEVSTEEYSVSEGLYIGRADSGSIEIETPEAFHIYQLTEEVSEMIDGVMIGSTMAFSYYENEHGRNVIADFEILKSEEEEVLSEEKGVTKSDEWIFIGMIDGHSAEFQKDGVSIVAQYSEQHLSKMNTLTEKDVVLVDYHENGHTQKVITNIVKK